MKFFLFVLASFFITADLSAAPTCSPQKRGLGGKVVAGMETCKKLSRKAASDQPRKECNWIAEQGQAGYCECCIFNDENPERTPSWEPVVKPEAKPEEPVQEGFDRSHLEEKGAVLE